MSKSYAYSVIHNRNISIDEAHRLYFAQTGKRNRFDFRCGDEICRNANNPLVIGVVYDRADVKGAKKTSRHFKDHKPLSHITGCTWVDASSNAPKPSSHKIGSSRPGSVISTNGLIFRPESSLSTSNQGVNVSHGPNSTNGGDKPETSRFMNVVANRYLDYTTLQKQSTKLEIKDQVSGTFYDVCRPLHTFHPYFQKKHFYLGYVKIIETNVSFLVQFIRKMDPDGSQNKITTAQIELDKIRLDLEEITLKQLLRTLALTYEPTRCFFYSKVPPHLLTINGGPGASFEMASLSHIAIIPDSTINTNIT